MKLSHYYKLIIGLFLCFCLNIEVSALDNAKTADVPVLMYHSIYKGGGDIWVITPDAFEQDLKYLSENGYNSVGVSDLVSFVRDGVPLPSKPVILSFDDGYYNNYSKVFPLLEKYKMKIVLSIIGEHTDLWSETDEVNEKYGHLNWNQLNEMLNSGYIELSNHTQGMHSNNNGRKGCVRKKGEDYNAYRELFIKDISELQDNIQKNCGVTPVCFAYPYGYKCPEALDNLKEIGFKMTLSCCNGINRLTVGDVDCLFDMYRENRTPNNSAQKILENMKKK